MRWLIVRVSVRLWYGVDDPASVGPLFCRTASGEAAAWALSI